VTPLVSALERDYYNNEDIVYLQPSVATLVPYRVTLRPYSIEILRELYSHFDLVLYSSDFLSNLEVLTAFLEKQVGRPVFSFNLGREHLKS